MEYVVVLVLVMLLIELLAMQKVWGSIDAPAQPEAAPQPQPVLKVYTAYEIRVIEKEAQYRRELRAARMGYCLLPRESNFRGLPQVDQA